MKQQRKSFSCVCAVLLLISLVVTDACRRDPVSELRKQGWQAVESGEALTLQFDTLPPESSLPALISIRKPFAVQLGQVDKRISQWSAVIQLTRLTIRDSQFHDLSMLRNLSSLWALYAGGTQVHDLTPL